MKRHIALINLSIIIILCVSLAKNTEANKTGPCIDKTGQSCNSCVSDFDCYYCTKTKLCGKRPIIKPSSDECSGDWYSYKQCTVTGNLLLIIVPSVLGGILLITICCCYWCCCRKISKRSARKRYAKEDARNAGETEAREMKHAERTAERNVRHDEIRRKYGLFKEEGDKDGKYQRFDVAA